MEIFHRLAGMGGSGGQVSVSASAYIAKILKNDWKADTLHKEIVIQLPDKEIRFPACTLSNIAEHEGWLYLFLGEPSWDRYFINTNQIISISYSEPAEQNNALKKFAVTTPKLAPPQLHSEYRAPVFKPFDKVLVRDVSHKDWIPQFFARLVDDNDYPFQMLDWEQYRYCIPYEGNEDLAFTNKPYPGDNKKGGE